MKKTLVLLLVLAQTAFAAPTTPNEQARFLAGNKALFAELDERARDIFRFYGGEGWRMGGDVLPSNVTGELLYTRREALGLVALVTPWNFPLAIPAWKMAPAVRDYCFFSHGSAEAGHGKALSRIGELPLLDLGMRLGEGTGAALGLFLLEAAAHAYNNMATFESAGVTI